MSAAEHITVWVDGVGVLAPGIADFAAAGRLLRGEDAYMPAPTVLPAPELLPPAERRRASRIVKAALAAGLQACRHAGADPAQLANVFAASGGDGYNCHALCEQLAQGDGQISPTRFHNSVHNAASGYWSIATGATPPAQVLGAHDASFAAGLLEAMTQVDQSGQRVLLVACDSEYPAPLHAKRPIADASALALVLGAARGERSMAQLRLARRAALQEVPASAWDAVANAELAQALQSLPPMRGWPIVQALIAQPAMKQVAIEYLPPQSLVLKVLPP